MTWQLWIIVVWLLFSELALIGMVGKKREPVTSGAAAFGALLTAVLIALVLWGA